MNKLNQHQIILYYRKTARYALNVLAGAIDEFVTEQKLPCHPLLFPKTAGDLVNELKACEAAGTTPVVLWSFYSPEIADIEQELQQARSACPNIKMIHIAGGVHASAEPRNTLDTGFDFAAVGEGEKMVTDMITALANDEPLAKVKGLHSYRETGYQRNGKGELVELDDYPPCSLRYKKMGPIEITRGCIYGCKFCQTPFFNKARFRHRSIDNIMYYVREMQKLGYKDYRFITPTSMSYGSDNDEVNLDAIETLLGTVHSLVKNRGRIFYGTFPSEVRPEHVSEKALNILKKYVHNDNLIIGGQSGSQAILDSSNRGHSVEAVIEAVDIAVRCGFKPNVDLLYGMPGETPEDLQASLQLAERLTGMGARIHSHTFMPLPGTPYRNEMYTPLDEETRARINLMHSHGQAYGQWLQQAEMAKMLTRFADKNPKSR